jgi:hypothetical protein
MSTQPSATNREFKKEEKMPIQTFAIEPKNHKLVQLKLNFYISCRKPQHRTQMTPTNMHCHQQNGK